MVSFYRVRVLMRRRAVLQKQGEENFWAIWKALGSSKKMLGTRSSSKRQQALTWSWIVR